MKENSESEHNATEEDDAQAFANACGRLTWQIAMFTERLGEEESVISSGSRVAKYMLQHVDMLAKMFPVDFDTKEAERFARDIEIEEDCARQKHTAFKNLEHLLGEIIADKKLGRVIPESTYERLARLEKDSEKIPWKRDSKFDCKFKHIMAIVKICIDAWLSSSGKYPPPAKDIDPETWWKAGISESPRDRNCGTILWQDDVGRFIGMWSQFNADKFTDPLPAYDWEGRVDISMKLLHYARQCVLYNDIDSLFCALDMSRGDDK